MPLTVYVLRAGEIMTVRNTLDKAAVEYKEEINYLVTSIPLKTHFLSTNTYKYTLGYINIYSLILGFGNTFQ